MRDCYQPLMLFTGRALYQIPNLMKGWWEEDSAKYEAPNADMADFPMLGELLRQNGYYTYTVGKWHNMQFSHTRNFQDGGKVYFSGLNTPKRKENTRGPHYGPNCIFDPTGEYDEAHVYISDKHSTEEFTESAVRFLDTYEGDEPFFLYCAFIAPHSPLKTDPQWHALYDASAIALPKNYKPYHEFDNGGWRVKERLAEGWRISEAEARQLNADHFALVTHMDDGIRRIHEALARNGFLDNTIVIHTSDHGKQEGHHGMNGKESLYEEAAKVPFIMAGPGVPRGERRTQLVHHHDLYPTLLEAADTPVPEETWFQSLWPLLERAGEAGRSTIASGYKDTERMIRNHRFKLIANEVEGRRRIRLFDLQNDPYEREDVSGLPEHADVVDALRSGLKAWQAEVGDPCEIL